MTTTTTHSQLQRLVVTGDKAPIAHLWISAGAPPPNWQGKARRPVVAPPPRPGLCALTGEIGPVWPLQALTTTLTTLDRFPFRDADPDGLAVGAAGAWAIRHRQAMLRPHAVTAAGIHREVDPPGLYDALVRAATDPTVMPSVPVRTTGAQVLPWARWGHVGTDTGWWPWSPAELELLATYRTLREFGFGEIALTEREPRHKVLARLDPGSRREVLHLWHHLDRWRGGDGRMGIAARATRTPKDGS